ncbi:MAG: hypothetical protein ACFFB3_20730 [Candidatus Hodarchaeota archaeon]
MTNRFKMTGGAAQEIVTKLYYLKISPNRPFATTLQQFVTLIQETAHQLP